MEAGFPPVHYDCGRKYFGFNSLKNDKGKLFFEYREVLEASGEGNILQGIPHCS
jgi:hypothetical protein